MTLVAAAGRQGGRDFCLNERGGNVLMDFKLTDMMAIIYSIECVRYKELLTSSCFCRWLYAAENHKKRRQHNRNWQMLGNGFQHADALQRFVLF